MLLMEKRKREILALCLLVVLGVIVAGAMAWYMMVGHSWNKAASHIDDLVGSMDGYTVIVYEGTLSRPKASKSQSASAASPAASSKSASPASASSSSVSASPASKPSEHASSKSEHVAVEADAVDMKKAMASYREKGASVIRLHVGDLDRYAKPLVFSQAGRCFGICAAPGKYRYVTVRDKVLELKEAQADFTVVIANKAGIMKGWLRNVNMVILSCDAHIPSGGTQIGNTFFVDAAYKGEVQAIIIAPSGTITAKTITDL